MKVFRLLSLVAIAQLMTKGAMACAACVGDPNSPMTHGAKAAVWFMLGTVSVVLLSFVGVAFFWMHRARLLDVQATLQSPQRQEEE